MGRKKKASVLSEDTQAEIAAMDVADLQQLIAEATQAIATATAERDANERYQEARLIVLDLSQAMKDTRKYQGAKIAAALARIREIRGDIT